MSHRQRKNHNCDANLCLSNFRALLYHYVVDRLDCIKMDTVSLSEISIKKAYYKLQDVSVAKSTPDDLSLILGTYGRKKEALKCCPLTSMHVMYMSCKCLHSHMYIMHTQAQTHTIIITMIIKIIIKSKLFKRK